MGTAKVTGVAFCGFFFRRIRNKPEKSPRAKLLPSTNFPKKQKKTFPPFSSSERIIFAFSSSGRIQGKACPYVRYGVLFVCTYVTFRVGYLIQSVRYYVSKATSLPCSHQSTKVKHSNIDLCVRGPSRTHTHTHPTRWSEGRGCVFGLLVFFSPST